jgi:O-acetyl-ADP-ribose deacetylase (regulator of RNase III)
MSDENYYKVGGSLEYQHPTYVVRQADSDLYDGLKNGEFCYVLNSRQMGKSSLRVQMMKKLKEQGVKCASVDMTRIGSHVTPQEWYAGVVSELLRGFSLSKKVNFSSWWRERELLPPLQRLRELIEDVLLAEFTENLVIFIDEIDSIIKIKFKGDFFAFIRACYNQRVDNPEYNRLTFCLLGVATPSDLIEDKNISTPFNIGRAIELTGFGWDEAQPLAQGLEGRVSRPEVVLREVLEWTGGQPFLTQKLCKLILTWDHSIAEGREAEGVEELVRSRIIENWETQDEPEHLRTVRDRIMWSDRKGQLLQLYQQILQTSLTPRYQGGDGGVKANDKPEHMELRLSGLVVKQQGKLRVYNRIYASVFDQSWVENALAETTLEPDVAETQAPSQAEIQALEQAALEALQQFEFQQIEALLSAMQAGQALKALVGDDCLLQDYPAVSPLLALQTILDNIRSNESREGFLGEFLVHNKLIKIYQGDITNLVTDVIVSSDDNYLRMGGGVSQRIRQIGGEDIYREVRNLIPLSLGEVAVTTAGNLRARKILHAVVIDFDESEGLSDKVIQRLVHTCMKKANRYRFQSIAFPLLGTGAGRFSAKAVWEIMLGQIISDLSDKNQNIIEVIICLYPRKIVEELKIINFLDAIEKFGWKSLL